MEGAIKSRFLFPSSALTGALLLAALAGCGGGSSSSRPTTPTALNSIVFISTRDGTSELYRMNPDGSAQTRLTTGIGSADNPSQARDGRIVFESNRDGNSEIYRINRDGSNLVRLTNDAPGTTVFDSQPAFSPDGQTIAWTSTRGGNQRNIFLMDSSGANQRQFTSDNRDSNHPTWTPDSQRLGFFFDTFIGRPASFRALEVRRVSTGEVTFQGDSLSTDLRHLRFNQDASKVVYASHFRGDFAVGLQIYDLASKTSTFGPAVTRDTTFPKNRAPDFSPDGSLIVWDALTDLSSIPVNPNPAQIYRANADGTGVTQLTTQGSNFSPDF